MAKITTSPVPVTEDSSSVTAELAQLRRRSRLLDPAIAESSAAYWAATDEMTDLLQRYYELQRQQTEAEETYKQAAAEQAEIDEQADALQQYIDALEASVKSRGGETGEGKKSKRRHKKFDRKAACQHRSNGLASLSDATHVKLVIKARHKAKKSRECDKPTSQIRAARLRKQVHRDESFTLRFRLTPADLAAEARKAEARKASKEGKRVKLLATLTDPARISVLLNGDLHS